MNFPERLAHWARELPDREAVAWPGGSHSFAVLHGWVNRMANGLQALGVQAGDRVLIQIGNRVEFIYAYFGIMQAGAVVVPVNPLYTAREVELLAADCQPVVAVLDSTAAANAAAIRRGSPLLRRILVIDAAGDATDFAGFLCDHAAAYSPVALDEESVCEIIYTSGTTGRPKGAMLTHAGLWLNAMEYGEVHKCTSADRALIVAPLFHSAAQTNCLNTMLVVGGAVYLLARFEPEVVLETLAAQGITYFFGPPTMYAMLLNIVGAQDRGLRLRIAFSGAAPMPLEVHRRWEEAFGFPVLEGYGLSEASPVVTQTRPDGVRKIGAVGPPLPSVTVTIVNDAGHELPPYEVGEVVVGGPCVMKGYWQNPEATSAALDHEGRLHTGDLGYLDDDGYLYIVDRKKDMINRGGMKIYPREVEEVLYAHPAVLEAAVVGVADPVMGEEVQAYITLANPEVPLSTDDVVNFCRERLAPYKVPRRVEVVTALPKTVSGKIRKVELRRQEPKAGGSTG